MGICAPVCRGCSAPSVLLYALRAVVLCLALSVGAVAALAAPEASAPSCAQLRPSPQLFRDYLRDPDLVLIDVRPPTEFLALGIPGALNVPLHAVKTKTFWKKKRLVLFDQGFGSGPAQACEELRRAGFSAVSVLQGGMVGWGARGGPLRGEVEGFEKLRRIKPSDIFVERGRDDVLYLRLAGTPASPQTLHADPLSSSLFFSRDLPTNELAGRIARAVDRRHVGRPTLLFVEESGAGVERIPELIRASRLEQDRGVTVFLLEGGLEAYQAYLAQRSQASSEIKKSYAACGSCP